MPNKFLIISINECPLSYDSMAKKYNELKYDYKLKENLSEEKKLEVDTLNVLELLGYPLEQTGTYFYKDIIVKIIKQMQESISIESYQMLISALNNDYSQFYFDIARNNYDVGLKTFHNCINTSRKTKKRKNLTLQQKIGIDDSKMNYKEEALLIANYITENQSKKEYPKIKKKATSYTY